MAGLTDRLGGARRLLLVGVALFVLLGGGILATGAFAAPSVTGVDNRFGGVNETTTVVESDLHVENPNPVGIDLGGVTVDYDVAMNGIEMATGTREGVSLPQGESTLAFTSRMRNERIPDWWVSHVKRGERTTLTVDAAIHSSTLDRTVGAPEISREIRTDLIGSFDSNETRPVNANHPLVSDPVLYVNETSAAWGDVNETTTPVETNFTVYNPKATPAALTEIGYTMTMNDVVVGEGATNRTYVVPSRETRTLETTTRIDNANLDEWWVTHLERNQTTDLRIEFYATFDVAGDSIRVPLDSLTYTKTFETDIFGTKAGNESSDGSADGRTAATTPGDSTSTTADTEQTTSSAGTGGTTTGTDRTTASPTATDGSTTDDGGPLGGENGTTTDDGGLLRIAR